MSNQFSVKFVLFHLVFTLCLMLIVNSPIFPQESVKAQGRVDLLGEGEHHKRYTPGIAHFTSQRHREVRDSLNSGHGNRRNPFKSRFDKNFSRSINEERGKRQLPSNGSSSTQVIPPSNRNGTLNSYPSLNDSILPVWVAQYTGQVFSSSDEAIAVAIAPNGNVYVAGTSEATQSGNDYLTIKFDSTGVQQWVARYNGPMSGYDTLTAMTVDASGNVYVTGWSEGSGTGNDYTTLKYNSSGVQEWVARYNGPENDEEMANSIAVDAAGNVYVSGVSYTEASFWDCATVKYNSNGIEQWVARYNGTGNSADAVNALSVDDSGNVYITGSTQLLTGDEDYLTIKYNTNGVEQWIALYDGGPGNHSDEAFALAVDDSGNVYVAGGSYGSAITEYDYAVVKYNANGVEQWDARYDGPEHSTDAALALSVDASGNVYVTGNSYDFETGDNFATIKYDTNGAELWVSRFNDPWDGDDKVSGLLVDSSGNVYVTGKADGAGGSGDFATIKYNAAGEEQWVEWYNGSENLDDFASAIALDSSGHVYVAGSTLNYEPKFDFFLITYDTNGVGEWTQTYNGPGITVDYIRAQVVDNTGNIYVLGTSLRSMDAGDYVTIKYDTNGIEQWVARYNGFGEHLNGDGAAALAVDNSGNVYVTGTSYGPPLSETLYDIVTIKYDANGIEQWIARYDGPDKLNNDGATAIAVDDSGNVYVSGTSFDAGTDYDYVTIKYNTNGVEQWVARYNGTGNNEDIPTALAIDASGNVYVTGVSATSGADNDCATIKYNTDGEEQWVVRYNGFPVALSVDQSGNVYLSGTGTRVEGGMNIYYAVIKYNTNGEEQWIAPNENGGDLGFSPIALAIDDTGNVYVTGTSYNEETSDDFGTIKYSANGDEEWIALYNGKGDPSFDEPAAIRVDSSGNIYVTGVSSNDETRGDFVTLKYKNNGTAEWAARYNRPQNVDEAASCISLDASGNVYVSGSVIVIGKHGIHLENIMTTLKYKQLPVFTTSSSMLEFGENQISCKLDKQVSVTNRGTLPLIITDISSDQPSITIKPTSVAIPGGGSQVFTVTFAPLTAGEVIGNMMFNHNSGSSPDTIIVSGVAVGSGSAISISTTFDALNWQLLSLPVDVVCPIKVKNLYEFQNGYVLRDTLEKGKGYWNKISETTFEYTGFPTVTDTFEVRAKWNIVGSISSPALRSAMSSIPEGIIVSPAFGYTSQGYFITDTLLPGFGYWLKVSQEGQIIYHAASTREKTGSSINSFKEFNQLSLSDQTGRGQTLYFSSSVQDEITSLDYQLPPPPPDGVFDARFESGNMVEFGSKTTLKEFPITISSAVYPVTINCTLVDRLSSASLVIDGKQYSLRGNIKIQVSDPESQVKLRFMSHEELPKSFSLQQNYPNPFNPVTTINYSLPIDSKVTLKIYNVLGQEITTLLDEVQEAGFKTQIWDAINLPSGIYFYKLTAGNFSNIKKMLLIR